MSFAHEKLKVYRKSLDSFAAVQPLLSSWSKQHALVDHLSRAMESVLFNLVEAGDTPSFPSKAFLILQTKPSPNWPSAWIWGFGETPGHTKI